MAMGSCNHPYANKHFGCPEIAEQQIFTDQVIKAWNEYCIPLPNTVDELNRIYVRLEQSPLPPAVVKEITKKLKAAVSPYQN